LYSQFWTPTNISILWNLLSGFWLDLQRDHEKKKILLYLCIRQCLYVGLRPDEVNDFYQFT
jgi:hypothetical protein